MAEDKKIVDPTTAGFYEEIGKTNVEKITNEMLAGLSGDSSDSENFDVETGNEDNEGRPWILMWRLEMKMPKVGRTMLFLESQLLNKGRLKRCRENISMIYL